MGYIVRILRRPGHTLALCAVWTAAFVVGVGALCGQTSVSTPTPKSTAVATAFPTQSAVPTPAGTELTLHLISAAELAKSGVYLRVPTPGEVAAAAGTRPQTGQGRWSDQGPSEVVLANLYRPGSTTPRLVWVVANRPPGLTEWPSLPAPVSGTPLAFNKPQGYVVFFYDAMTGDTLFGLLG